MKLLSTPQPQNKFLPSCMLAPSGWCLSLVLLLWLPLLGFTQTPDSSGSPKPNKSLSLEIDPAPFFMKGYSLSLRYSTRALPHWSVMGSLFQGSLPDALLTRVNQERGWHDFRMGPSYALFVDYSLNPQGRGLLVGPALFVYANSVKSSLSNQRVGFRTLYPNIRVGYTLFPFKGINLYLTPWFNVGKEFRTASTTGGPEPTYQLSPIKYILALHVGYRYQFAGSSRHQASGTR